MPKRKANTWPVEIYADPDVLSLDEEGRYVNCRVCSHRYSIQGGKRPKPVIMNSCYRTRAWDVHKNRTKCHRSFSNHHTLQAQKRYCQENKAFNDVISDTTHRKMFSQVSNVSEGYDIKQPINPGVHGETGSSYLRTGNLNERFWSNIHESTVKALNKVQDRERKQEEIQAFLQASRNVEGARSRPSNQFIRGHDAITRTSPLAYARKEERVRQYCGVVRRIYSKIEENKCMEEDKRPSIKRRASIENERSPSPAGPASGHNYCCDIRSVTMASSKSGSEESLEMDEIGDQALLNAMDRLSGIISKNSDLFSQNNCIEGNMLNSMVQKFEDMRQHQRMYLDRLVNIEERRANAMEAMLQYKIRKEERKLRDATYLIELQTTRAHDTTDSRRVVHCGSS